MLKPSNIWKAGVSTFLGLIAGTMTTLGVSIAEGTFTWASVGSGLAVAAIMAMTDVLKEVKKQLDEEEPK